MSGSASPTDAVARVDAHGIGAVFAATIQDLVANVPPNVTAAVDLAIEFKSVNVDSKGFLSVVFGGSNKEDSTTIRLATRVYVGDRTVS